MAMPSQAVASTLTQDPLVEADKAHYMHGYHMFDEHREQGALNIVAGEGAYIHDTEGNRFLDAVGGMWCTNIGLGREEMAQAIADQVRKLAYSNPFSDMANDVAIQLCRKLAQLAPGDLDHVFLTTGGSTAVDTAYRLIQYYQNCRGKPHKKHIIARFNAYHGSTTLTMSIGNKAADRVPEFDYLHPLIHHVSNPNPYRAPDDMDEAEFLDFLVAEFEDKILSLGACIFSERIWQVIAEPGKGRCFTHGFTYSGHPVCCTAALKNIEIIERENLLAHVNDVGAYLEQRLGSLRELPLVGDVRCMKLMACVEFVADKASKALFDDAVNIGERIHRKAQAKGLLVRPIMHLNVMSPPLVITHAQVDEIVQTLRHCILETAEELRAEGLYQGR
ncbi:aminotransferase class III-fold pyridoxal phosphate-dependent enzyme [Pseudomonas putida]|nr:aminotransferase class III-fold pyridoxal phosphate-dependent enzyme [Pseudomonas putida]